MTVYPKYDFILQSFGLQNLKTLIYSNSINAIEENDSTKNYSSIVIGDVPKVADSYLGTPVFDNIVLDIDDNNLRIDTVLIDVSQTKNIVKTAIQGLSGTIKEYIADGDYEISIKGIIVNESNEYPTADISSLLEICKKNENIRVTSNFLQLFGIDDIIIESYTLKQDEFSNTQQFELSCVSDKPVELLLNSNL
jgi:hypothetical protein